MKVAFLNRTTKMGSKSVVGPATGIHYLIEPTGTPVSALDADALLSMTEPPCCGETLPFGGEVRSFGSHSATYEQMQLVPEYLWDAEAIAVPKKKSGRKKKLHVEYEKPEEEALLEVVVEDTLIKEKSEEER